jgi:hypothetical protein
MLVLAAFIAIGAFFVAFLLRFYFALHSEARLASERAAWAKQIRSRRLPSSTEDRSPATGLTLAYSNPSPARQPKTGTGGARLVARDASGIQKKA